MLVVYNLLQTVALIIASPLLFVKVLFTPKYRGRILGRLGVGIEERLPARLRSGPSIWLHALSVGEVSSAQPLAKGLRAAFPQATLFFSATTRAGEAIARQKLSEDVDAFIPFPLDFGPSVRQMIKVVKPDLFILVETDFWPNFLAGLQRKHVPALLVNGRISERSLRRYLRFRWLFRRLFASFSFLSMQTAADARKMVQLGAAREKVLPLGNLKFDAALPVQGAQASAARRDYGLREGKPLWIAGSTHPGEEEMIFSVFKRLLPLFPDLTLVIAPRQVARGRELVALAAAAGLGAWARSAGVPREERKVLVLDTLGELAGIYALGDFAFIGGSLVEEGGHNPLEPAVFGKPVLFGPHMEDFAEISQGLLESGGARVVANEEQLFQGVREWLSDPQGKEACGRRASALIRQHRGATARHLELIKKVLAGKAADEK